MEELEMKFIVSFEGGDIETAKKKIEDFTKMSKKAIDAGLPSGKSFSPIYFYANSQGGFQLFEAESAESLAAIAIFYEDSDFTFTPIIEMSKAFKIKEMIDKASK